MRFLRNLMGGDWLASVLTGAFYTAVVARMDKPHPILAVSVFGAVYALAVHGLMSLFGVRRWGWVVAGMLCGPLPAAILMPHNLERPEERGGAILAALLLGIFLGLVRWAREARREAQAAARPVLGDPGE